MRPLKDCTALLFDGSSADAPSRLFDGARRLWLVRGDEVDAVQLLHTTLQQIDHAARHAGAHVVMSMSFEASAAFDGAAGLQSTSRTSDTPWLQAIEFDAPRLLDRAQAVDWLLSQAAQASTFLTPITSSISESEFTTHIERIRALIAAGDTYQVNFTFPLTADLIATASGDAALAAMYQQLVCDLKIPYGALLTLPHNSLLSFSPELFFELAPNALTCRPMKGTAAVSDNDVENTQRAATLAADPKNRAENLMIVDLMRNDLSRLPQVDKVSVPKLFEVKRYGSVLQMTSTVKAHLTAQPNLAELFNALFPCGSITGAPKRRTLEIIHELESKPRGAYCGAIGFVEPAAQSGAVNAIFSVPIRTIQTTATPSIDALGLQHWPLNLSVGAGITFESDAADEWQESLLKAKFLTTFTQPFELIETMRVEHDGSISLIETHWARLQRSALALGWSAPDANAFQHAIQTALNDHIDGQTDAVRLRLTMQTNGHLNAHVSALEAVHEPVFVTFNNTRMQSTNPFLQHKTSARHTYNAALRNAKESGLFDSVFVNEKDEVTEGARSNIFILRDGVWYTPPLTSGVLAGVQRAELIEQLHAREVILSRTDVLQAEQIMLCNALYGSLKAVVR